MNSRKKLILVIFFLIVIIVGFLLYFKLNILNKNNSGYSEEGYTADMLFNLPDDTITNAPVSQDTTKIINYPLSAEFTVTINGIARKFNSAMYSKQDFAVYIDETDSSKIIVTEAGVTWQDFFDTMPAPFKLTNDCITTGTSETYCTGQNGELKFMLNGVETPEALDLVINAGDILNVIY